LTQIANALIEEAIGNDKSASWKKFAALGYLPLG
jgi:hypothetical protein